jgi:hypothetical protein
MAKEEKQTSMVPLGRAFRLKELKGYFQKFITIPPGRTGVVVEADGQGRTLAPGYHRLLTVIQRLRGRGVGLAAGYVPKEPFNLRMAIPYLLSGDGKLVDLNLACVLEVNDPVKFFTQVVLPQGTFQADGMEVNDEMARKMLGSATTKYAAADLVHGLPPRLNGELLNALGMFAAGWGLSVRNIPLVVITNSDDRLAIAEKTQALQERLQDVALQAKMAEIENQAQLDEFIQQVDPQAGAVVHPQVAQAAPAEAAPLAAAAAPAKDAPAAARKPGEYLRTLFGGSGAGNSRRGGLLAGLFHQKPKAAAETRELPHLWWLMRTLWMAIVLIMAGIITYLVFHLAASASVQRKLEFLLPTWGFAITYILTNIKVLAEKSENAFEITRPSSASSRLDDLVGDDRRRADELVREQCQKELGHVREVLQDIRTREFKRDKTEMALKLRNELEQNAEEGIKKIGSPDYGCPAYVTDLYLNRNAWNDMLNYDEDLLGYAHALSDKAHLLQQKSQADELDMAQLAGFDTDISDFRNRFFERGRPIKIHSQETN